MNQDQAKAVIEALIFAAEEPLTTKAITSYVDELNGQSIDELVELLNAEYEQAGRAVQIVRISGGFQMTTRPEYVGWIKKMYAGRSSQRLSQAALETLAIIAFQQPISKTEIAAVRGVNSDWTVKTLLEKGLVAIRGRSDTVGKPLIYGTTNAFLQYFGINDITELPKPREIEELFGDSKYSDQIIEALSKADGADEAEEAEAPSISEETEADTESDD